MSSSSRLLNIAVDVNPATRQVATGTEVFTREVSRRLPAAAPDLRWRFYASRPKAGLGVDATVLPFRRLWSQLRLPVALAADHPDLLFVPGHIIPFAWGGKSVAVVHDLAFERHPEAYSPADRAYLRLTTRWAAARSKLLVAVSEATRHDLVELYAIAPERVRVVPLGVTPPAADPAPPSRLEEMGLRGDFVLQVGRVEPRKNQVTALAAVERLEGVTLVVAGPERDAGLSERLRNSTYCRLLGPVDQPLLELLYDRAAAVVVPSLYEGFGLPVLEAMARGKVVVAALTSSLPEVGGEAALYYQDPSDAQHLASVLDVALHDKPLRAKIAQAARERAAQFTWERTAAGIAGVIREAAS